MEQKIKKAKIISVADYSYCENIDKNAIVITATQNLKKNTLFNSAKLNISFADLLSAARDKVDYSKCINSAELKYLIQLVIDKLFNGEKVIAYKNCINKIEELLSIIIMSKVNKKVQKNLKNQKYSEIENDMLEIINRVIKEIGKRKLNISKMTLIEEASKIVNQYNKVIFVGFVFFNQLQENLIKMLNCEELIFINNENDFIDQELISPLLENLKYTIVREHNINTNSNILSLIGDCLFTDKEQITQDGIIEFHEPFSNREEEFIFIAKEISNAIRKRNMTIDSIEKSVQEFAVVLTKNKTELTKILNDAFGQYGIFIPPYDENFKIRLVYYSKEEFLKDEISKDGRLLTHLEKLELFNKCRRIKAGGSKIQISDFAIGKFIIEVYNVVSNDLTIESFKTLINTHWYLNKVADNEAIEDFYKLQTYFEHLTTIEEWKNQAEKLTFDKKKIMSEYEFKNHPLYVVSEQSLLYIKSYIVFLESLINTLKVNASIKNQIEILITGFGLYKVELPTAEEKEMLTLFIQSLENIKGNDTIKVDYKYFADHIKDLIQDYSNIQENDKNSIRLSVVNMENFTKYDYVYFPMFEEDKYPRILKREFPYTKSITRLLKESGVNMQRNLDMEYHLKMSRHIFKNVFSFTNKKLIFTYTCKEKGNDLSISVYAKDIARAINKKINFIAREKSDKTESLERRSLVFKKQEIKEINLNELISKYVCPKQFYYSVAMQSQICYTDKFLLNFYAKALIVNKFFRNLALTEKEFVLSSEEFEHAVIKIFEDSYKHIMQYFSMFSENEKRDIRITSKKAIYDFIETHFKSGKFAAKKAKFLLGKSKDIRGEFSVRTHQTIIMINTIKNIKTEFDISRNIDYLISSSGGKKYKYEHFSEIIEQLQKNAKYDDKLDLLNFASFKVNTQLNSDRFLNDGIARVKRIIEDTSFEYSNMGYSVSTYCRFCKMKNTCKGVLIDE